MKAIEIRKLVRASSSQQELSDWTRSEHKSVRDDALSRLRKLHLPVLEPVVAPSSDRRCPKCGATKAPSFFGWRTVQTQKGPRIYSQPWCRECRRAASARSRAKAVK